MAGRPRASEVSVRDMPGPVSGSFSRGTAASCFLLAGLICVRVAPPPSALAQDTLQQLRASVRPAREASASPEHPPADDDQPRNRRGGNRRSYFASSCDEEDEDDFLDALLAPFVAPFVWVTASAATSPFWGPARLVGDDWRQTGYFPHFPYEDNLAGYMMRDSSIEVEPRTWSLRVRGEFMESFDSVSSIGGHVLWESSQRFGLDADVRHVHEQWGAGHSDQLWIGDANLVFRFAQSPHLQMRAGIGLNWMADAVENDFGMNFTYGGDWYPRRPLIVSGELDIGRLGEATYFHARLTAGVQWHRYEVFAGYDYLDVGTVQMPGLVSGVRLWY